MINRPPQTVLYYPNMTLPSNDWLRHSLLYWDGIKAIVPRDDSGYVFNEDMRLLKDEGQFSPIDFLSIYVNDEKFKNDILDIITSEHFNRLILPPEDRDLTSKIHATKANPDLLDIFVAEGLATPEPDGVWYKCETITAFVYMSMLADYISQQQSVVTVPSTDMQACERLIFEALYPNKIEACLSTELARMLPVPRQDIPLMKIIEFKRNRNDELLQFRTEVDALHIALGDCKTKQEVAHQVAIFAAKIELGLSTLNKVLRDADITTVSGSMKALIQAATPAVWSGGLVAAGISDTITHSSVEATLTGLAVGATIMVTDFLATKRVERNRERRNSPVSYLLSAQTSKIF